MPRQKPNQTTINTIRHPERTNCSFFFTLIVYNLDRSEPNNAINLQDLATDGMLLTRATSFPGLNSYNIDLDPCRMEGHPYTVGISATRPSVITNQLSQSAV